MFYIHYRDVPAMMHAPVTKGAIKVFMIKFTIQTDKQDTKQTPHWVEIEPGFDASNK